MRHHDPRVDNYIAKSAAFAQPILRCLRESVHSACPDVEESLKWGAPSFGYRGKILCSMAAFKQHASFGFWQAALVVGGEGEKSDEGMRGSGMGQFGRLGQLSDLPEPLELADYLAKAMKLIDDGVPRPSRKDAGHRAPPLLVPEDLAAGLKEHPIARATFERFTPSQQRDYIVWITDAKREETRQRRLAQAIEWLGDGKPRNWKYMNC